MTTEEAERVQTWQKACEIAGVWKPGQRCQYHYEEPAQGEFSEVHIADHDIPCPPVGDPAATVKMLDWALREKFHYLYFERTVAGFYCEPTNRDPCEGATWPLALAAAIVAIGEKK